MNLKLKKWTLAEEAQLKKEVKTNMTARVIAERHGRTEKSINQKIYKMRKRDWVLQYPADVALRIHAETKPFIEPNEKPYTDPGIDKILFAIAVMLFILCALTIIGFVK